MKHIGIFRTSIFFALFLTFASMVLGYIFVLGDRDIGDTGAQITHANRVIEQAKDLSSLVEGMLANQRGFMLTGKAVFMDNYHAKKQETIHHLTELIKLTADNPTQTERIIQIQQQLSRFAEVLEKRADEYKPMTLEEGFIRVAEEISRDKDDILEINNMLLNEEYNVLNRLVLELEQKKTRYYSTIATGGVLAIILVFLFNVAGLYLLSRRAEVERLLKTSEDRFALAVEGTNDGIFDWDLVNDRVFYSRQFFAMLGLDRPAFIGSFKDFRNLIHPEDEPKVWQYIERYLHHDLSEYSNSFRMQHISGRWIWVNSRAKATFSSEGKPLRMVGANTDITYMKEYQERLKDEKQKAENASRAKGEFLAHMSHEIRTPLTAISGIAEIFQRNDKNLDEKQKRLVKTLYSSTSSLKDLVNDILDFSKIESGELELKEEVFNLLDLFQQVVAITSVQAAEKGLEFKFENHGIGGKAILTDPLRFRQVIINLVSNAIKFTEKGGVTIVATHTIMDGVPLLVVKVIDTGIGILAENIDMIFERFKQVDASVSRRYGGSGLGLTISKNLVTLMGGNLSVESRVNEGSVFTVTLPWKEVADIRDDHMALPVQKVEHKTKPAFSTQKRILLVEDYEGNIVVVSYILEELGCRFDIARTGVQALELWRKKHYDIILMDVQMPEMDGFTATARIREIEKEKSLKRTPIIGMTAHALVGDKNKCIEAGMDAYLPKPIVEVDMKAEILKYLNTKEG